jgi:hypothetical protein
MSFTHSVPSLLPQAQWKWGSSTPGPLETGFVLHTTGPLDLDLVPQAHWKPGLYHRPQAHWDLVPQAHWDRFSTVGPFETGLEYPPQVHCAPRNVIVL